MSICLSVGTFSVSDMSGQEGKQITYRLSTIVQAHEKDVRCICRYGSNGGFVTGSRDEKGKVFLPSKSGRLFVEAQMLTGARKYIACCAVISSSQPDVPDRIYLGCHDAEIYCYTEDEMKPIAMLSGHSGPVSALASDNTSGRLLSGSWDCTAILWQDNNKLKIITGHSQSVLAVAFLRSDLFVTGSADMTIKVWNDAGQLKETFFGHKDAVRAIEPINEDLFMSCGNDGTLRRWSVSRSGLIRTYECHNTYVYGMTFITSNEKTENEKIGFISCSEDRTMKVYVRGKLIQIIPVPSETIWSIISLGGSEIAAATSSGRVFVYSSDPEKHADNETVQLYETMFDTISISPTEKGDLQLLDSKDQLNQLTQETGARGLVKNGGNTDVYIYLNEMPVPDRPGGWIKIGFMKGSDAASMNKNEYEGKLYDYVINVDMEDGQPLLKLPFNIGDDPKKAAIEFITRHNLPPAYLDTIEQFIISNVVKDAANNAPSK